MLVGSVVLDPLKPNCMNINISNLFLRKNYKVGKKPSGFKMVG